jgi:hypothetical protein
MKEHIFAKLGTSKRCKHCSCETNVTFYGLANMGKKGKKGELSHLSRKVTTVRHNFMTKEEKQKS